MTAPQTSAIRPTTDRVRESIFNVLLHLDGVSLHTARVLDLFAGTGALGIEALSRGAGFCLFVDHGIEARGVLRQNVEELGLHGCTKIFKRDATSLGPVAPHEPFNLVFADPPYGQGLAEKALASAARNGWLSQNALIIVEEKAESILELSDEFMLFDTRVYGDSAVQFYYWRDGNGSKT